MRFQGNVLLLAAGLIFSLSLVLPVISGQQHGAAARNGGNIKDFGAVGDGRADDTAAIQRAVDRGTGNIRLPRGVYRITRPIVVDLDRVGVTSINGQGTARIIMDGAGPAIRFVGTHQGTADPGTFKPNVWDRQRMPMVSGIEIVGNHREAIGIQASGTMQLTVTRTNIRGALHGIHLVKRNRNVIISECHVYENRGVGVFLDHLSLHQINISNCHVSYNGGGGVVVRGGDVRNLHIGTCDLEANMAADGPATANVLLDCTGGSVAEVAITGCTIQHTHNAPDSANIRMIGSDSSAKSERLRQNRYGHVTISGNVLSDVQYNIDLAGARTVAISGNTMWKGFTRNIRIVDSSHVVLGANVLDRNPRYRSTGEATNAVELRGCRDCTISGLHLQGTEQTAAGVMLQDCQRINITNCTLLDCEGAGIRLKNVTHSRVSDCLIRDDRAEDGGLSLVVTGGRGNLIVDNLLGSAARIDPQAARGVGNHVVE